MILKTIKNRLLYEQSVFRLPEGYERNDPDGNGIDLFREIRRDYHMPVILLRVDDMEMDVVTGLEVGDNITLQSCSV